jgi:prolyl-tRNA editing enzyme YbaK/EbsC (Cys-tRNA(Pro) deacylase)
MPPSLWPAWPQLAAVDDIETRVRARLQLLGVNFEAIPCDPEFADTAAFCARYGFALEDSANTIVVASRRDPAVACACVALATTRLDVNHTVRSLLGAGKVSFASPEQTESLTGMRIGGVTPFALPDTLPLYIDAQVMRRPSVVVGGGSRSWKVRVAPLELLLVPEARTVEGLALEVAHVRD